MSDVMEVSRVRPENWDGCCPGCLGAPDATDARGFRRCQGCGTVWVPSRRVYSYDDEYPAFRGHHDDAIAFCKIRTFQRWCEQLDARLAGRNVLEVGFGGGATIAWMHSQGAQVSGVEPVDANRACVARAGIPERNIQRTLADIRTGPFDLVIYQDSFEHETEPAIHLANLDQLTETGARALLVLPIADCASRKVMGRWWPHDIRDHWVFYSSQGLTRLWEAHGWRRIKTFYPSKYISGLTIARHVQLKIPIWIPARALRPTAFWLNFGELGFIFEKS